MFGYAISNSFVAKKWESLTNSFVSEANEGYVSMTCHAMSLVGFLYGGLFGFENVHIIAVWEAAGLKYGIQAYYPHILYLSFLKSYRADIHINVSDLYIY